MRPSAAAALACLLASIAAAAAQQPPSTCLAKTEALSSTCNLAPLLSQISGSALIGAPDSALKLWSVANDSHPGPQCCDVIKAFAGRTPPYTACACDSQVASIAQTSGLTPDNLITLVRLGAVNCGDVAVRFSGPSQDARCPLAVNSGAPAASLGPAAPDASAAAPSPL